MTGVRVATRRKHVRMWAAAVFLAAFLLPAVLPAGAQQEGVSEEESQAEQPERPRVGSVSFSGNQAFEDSRLRRIMITRPWRLWSRNRYFPEVLAQDLETLRRFYEQNGYLQARITDTRVQKDPEGHTADIEIEIEEGPLTTVAGVSISGNVAIEEAQLRAMLDIEVGGPFQPPVVREDTLELMRAYADQGYLEADIRPDIRIDPQSHQARIEFVIEEKTRFRIGRIRTRGNEKTRTGVIEQEITFEPGDIVRYSELLDTQRRLFRTGLFQSVFVTPVRPISGEADRRDILVEVQEVRSIELNASVGYSTVGKLGAGLEVRDTNIAGTALKAGLAGSIDFISRSVEASFTEPRTFGTRLQTDLVLRLEQLEEPAYDLARITGDLKFTRRLGERSSASLGYRYERARIGEVRLAEVPPDPDSDLHSLLLTYTIDTRDDLADPSRGFFLQWENEVGQELPNLSNPFYRLIGTARGFLPVTSTTVLGTSLSAGWQAYLRGGMEFPLNQRFYTGGPSSLRGFDYQMVGPLDPTGNPLGGTLQAVWNILEIRQDLIGPVGGVLFLDGGGVWARPEDFAFGDIRFGLGTGLRLNTPIGVVRLDGALKLQPRDGESLGAVYLGFGHAF